MLSLLGDVGFVLDMPTHVSLVMLFASRVRVVYIYKYIQRHIPRIYIHTYTRTCVSFEFGDVPTCAAYNVCCTGQIPLLCEARLEFWPY